VVASEGLCFTVLAPLPSCDQSRLLLISTCLTY
jgi:hypothetical protein